MLEATDNGRAYKDPPSGGAAVQSATIGIPSARAAVISLAS